MNQLRLSSDCKKLFVAVGNENKYGRWKTSKITSKIMIFELY